MGSSAPFSAMKNLPPRAEGHSLRDLIQNPLDFFMHITKEHGDIVQYRATGERAFFINHPDYIRQVLHSNWKNYNKDTHLNKYQLKSLLGNGIITSEPPLWNKQRRLLQPSFHRKHLDAFTEMMNTAVEAQTQTWQGYIERDEPINIASEMMHVTLSIITQSMFGFDVSEVANTIEETLDVLVSVARPKHEAVENGIKVLDDIVYGMIEKRKSLPESQWNSDLLSFMLQARYDDTGEQMSDVQIRDEMMTLLVAGHETTANTLSWFWYVLAKNPAEKKKIRQELFDVLDKRKPSLDDFASIPYTNMAISEAMRLYPSAWSISRRALEDDEIGGYHIPARSIVAMSPYVVHRHPDFWESPEEFIPTRFDSDASSKQHPYAYIPFGRGPRQCIGQHFALMESTLIIAHILRHFDFELVSDHPVVPHVMATLRPKHGILMHLSALREEKHS